MSRPQSTPTQKPTYVVGRLPFQAIASPSKYGSELRFRAPIFLSDSVAALWLNDFSLAEVHRKPIVGLHTFTRKAGRVVSASSTDARREESIRLRARTFGPSGRNCSPTHEEIPSNFLRALNEAEQAPDGRPARLTVIYPVLH